MELGLPTGKNWEAVCVDSNFFVLISYVQNIILWSCLKKYLQKYISVFVIQVKWKLFVKYTGFVEKCLRNEYLGT